MLVIRKGKIKEVKKIWAGDIYISHCTHCKAPCISERLKNGHDRDRSICGADQIFEDKKELEFYLIAEKAKENEKTTQHTQADLFPADD